PLLLASDASALGLQLGLGLPQLRLNAFRVPVRGLRLRFGVLLACPPGTALVAQLLRGARRGRFGGLARVVGAAERLLEAGDLPVVHDRALYVAAVAVFEGVEGDDEPEPEVGTGRW